MRKQIKRTSEEFIAACKLKHGDKYDYSKAIYKNAKTKIYLKCNTCKNEFWAVPHQHLRGSNCRKCVYKNYPQNQQISHEQFVEKARKMHGNKFEYIETYKGATNKIYIKCNNCGDIFHQLASSHSSGNGCKKCVYKNNPKTKPFTVKYFEELCNKIHNNKYEYFQDYKNNKCKIKVKCKKCNHKFSLWPYAHSKHQQGCPVCNASRGEEKISWWLIENHIHFETQKTFKECRNICNLHFDFYLPRYNTCIEYDGEMHFFPLKHFGGEKRFIKYQENDQIKNEYCQQNNIHLIRIPFYDFDNIPQILEKAFNT